MNPAPDVDKTSFSGNNSCYLATASNMLAGAGYGNGTTVQARANNIYNTLINQFGIANGGWTDAALSWWLSSTNNTWTTNPYTLVTVYGNKSPMYPWSDANGAMKIANHLRSCDMVGLSISWPIAGSDIGSGGHAITSWGDGNWWPWEDYNKLLTSNTTNVRVADSDNDSGGDIQQYTYDSYSSPNPGGPNEGNGWYLNYNSNHPYIKHIITLSPTQTPAGNSNVQRVIGSFRITQNNKLNATDLHYKVRTDVEILSYNTRVSWDDKIIPAITETGSPRQELDVNWDFTNKPLPVNSMITITTEFMLRYWNAIAYDQVHFTYPEVKGPILPAIGWQINTPELKDASKIRNVTGGYIIASFEITDTINDKEKSFWGEYRLIHQYSFNQSPEYHSLILYGSDGYKIKNLKLGHSYGVPSDEDLWKFDNWLSSKTDTIIRLSQKPVKISIDWAGRLPYPEGENIEKSIPNINSKKR